LNRGHIDEWYLEDRYEERWADDHDDHRRVQGDGVSPRARARASALAVLACAVLILGLFAAAALLGGLR
jgi:hypothetical protein